MKSPHIYQTVVMTKSGRDISISYDTNKMSAKEREILEKFGVRIITHRKLK